MKKKAPFFKVFPDSKIYVIGCPWVISGGPEALHQLVYYLNQLSYDAYLVYPDSDLPENYEIPEPYLKYVDSYLRLSDIDDNEHNIIVFSEGHRLEFFSKFKHIQKGVWFLSVNYYRAFYSKDFPFVQKLKRLLRISKHYVFSLLGLDFFVHDDDTVKMAASYYAFDYLTSHKGCPKLMIEPISLEFIDYFKSNNYSISCDNPRENNILYNPARTDNEFMVERLKPLLPEYRFIPLKGLTHDEMSNLMLRSKVYIDFGSFPGAERIPKEAAVFGMCIITGKNGAAHFHNDVPIPEKYKFDNYKNELTAISDTIIDLMNNYKERTDDFSEYRQTIYNLEPNFKNQLLSVFKKQL